MFEIQQGSTRSSVRARVVYSKFSIRQFLNRAHGGGLGNGNAVSAADDDELSNKGHDDHENDYASMDEDDADTDGLDPRCASRRHRSR